MKTRLLIIALFALVPLVLPDISAICAADVNYNYVLQESELAFTGTVTRLDNYGGPQKVTFLIHDVVKGDVNTPKHVFENTGMVFLENDTIMSSSTDVDYKIGKTYKVYVINGQTSQCTTKITAPPANYMWEPGPEDGNYYSDEYEKPLHKYQDANERESYRDALENGSIMLPAEPSKLTDTELDAVMDSLYSHGLDHTELPIASIAIDYKRDILVLWTPDLTLGNKIQELIGDVSFVLLYEEAPARWEHDGPSPEPIPEPEHDETISENCGPGTILEDGVCVVNSENNSGDTGTKWGDSFYEKLPPPNLEPVRDYDYEFIYVVVLFTVVTIGGIVSGIILVIRRNRK